MNPQREAELDKPAFRRAMLLQLQELSVTERAARSEKICARVAETTEWQRAKRILLFSPLGTEPQIAPLETAALAANCEAFIIPPTLRDEAQLELPFAPDLVLVPGLAFTREGHRLGRGGGFYDRLLAGRAAAAFKLGICFNFQLRDTLPTEPHDAKVDAVITD